MWPHLKNKQLGFRFRRQAGIGKYIVDFYCPEKKLIVELDGSQHVEEKLQYDKDRELFLNSQGLKVLRIWNNEIREKSSGVVEEIKHWLK